jgi:hypothetical protein
VVLIRGNTNVLFVQRHPAPGDSDLAGILAFLCALAVGMHGVLVEIEIAGVPAIVAIPDVAGVLTEDGISLPLLSFPFSF